MRVAGAHTLARRVWLTHSLRCLASQAVLDAGYEEDMFISNTKIGARAAWRRLAPGAHAAASTLQGWGC